MISARWTGASARSVTLRRWPTIPGTPLLRTSLVTESHEEYLATWRTTGGVPDFEQVEELCRRIGLRGRGGAGFPLAIKLRAVHEAARSAGVTPIVVANGDESEPASVKDRYLLRDRPHLVLDGLTIAARSLSTRRAIVHVADEDLAMTVRQAAACWTHLVDIDVVVSPARYVAGEETAVVRMINEGVPKPTAKPPRPYQRGVDGLPTLVSNVETLAHLARGIRLGSNEIMATGSGEDRGVTLMTLVPDQGEPCLVETPYGVPLMELLRHCGVIDQAPTAVMTGGFFGGFLPRSLWDLPVGHAGMRAAGTTLGCGSILVLRAGCPVSVARELLQYFARENAQQCGVCINGTRAMADALSRIAAHEADPTDRAKLLRWSDTLPGRGDCMLLDAACGVVSSLVEHGDGVLDRHLDGPCSGCRNTCGHSPRTGFEVRLPEPCEGEQ